MDGAGAPHRHAGALVMRLASQQRQGAELREAGRADAAFWLLKVEYMPRSCLPKLMRRMLSCSWVHTTICS